VHPTSTPASIIKLNCLYSGTRLGRQISDGFAHMPMLKVLVLDFELQFRNSDDAWSVLAKAPAIPTLEILQLKKCFMDMTDFTDFPQKHSVTWKSLTLGHLHFGQRFCGRHRQDL
jgi:hypothetical protein